MRRRPVKDLVAPASASMPLSQVWWPLRHGFGLFLGDLPQVSLPVRLVLVQGPGECRGLFSGHLCLSLGPHGLGLRGLLLGPLGLRPGPFGLPRRLAPGVAAHAAELVVLAALLISPMMIVSWGSGP